VKFVKMEGLGNDFIVVTGNQSPDTALVQRICDRRRGVGADGVLLITDDSGQVTMHYWNADGSMAETCGNGLRCVARFAFDEGMADGPKFSVMTAIGPRQVESGEVPRVELGPTSVGERFAHSGLDFTRASVGNPHAVHIDGDPATQPVSTVGPALERDTPGGINVEFAQVMGRGELTLRVWERGVGETAACGTGMAAAAAVARAAGMIGDHVEVVVPGGRGAVDLIEDVAWLTGPANYVFWGEWKDA
jgi:diaminopimelate epimerase